MFRPPTRLWAWAFVSFVSFVAVAAVQSWPLPLHLSTHLTGNPGGDTGSYLWNLWVFRHELIEHGTSPFKTETILSLNGPTDLSLHNYTIVSALLAAPLVPLVGLVTAFNLVYLLKVALAGLGMFLLVRHLHERAGIGTAEAWLAGLLFACSPYLVARSTAHFSLIAAAPLPFFVLFFDRAWQRHSTRDAAAAGACLAWAAFSDPYYGIYCVLLGVAVVAGDFSISRAADAAREHRALRRVLDALLVLLAITIAVGLLGVHAIDVGTLSLSMRTLYTPVLLLTVLACARVLLTTHPRLHWSPSLSPGQFASLLGVVAIVGTLLLSPQLLAIAARASDGRMVHAPVPWRSSAPGLDVLAFVLPNPNHALAPPALVDWFVRQPGHFEENVASIPLVVIGVLIAGWRLRVGGFSNLWAGVGALFAVMALGPFIRVAGINTYVPTPWTFLRYVPVIAEARMPPRMAVVVILAVAILFAGVLTALCARYSRHRRLILAIVGAALAFELNPAPRHLYSAAIPSVYQFIKADPRDVRVLELPFGVRDGLSSMGDFTARAQFHQTLHGKRLVGGSMSRVSDRKKAFYRSWPYLNALLTLSEPNGIPLAVAPEIRASGADFVRRTELGYVVMEQARMRPELRAFALESLQLELIDARDGYELYRPRFAP